MGQISPGRPEAVAHDNLGSRTPLGSFYRQRARTAMITIKAQGRTYELRPEPYWHLTPARGSILLNNAHVGDGICRSVTAFRPKPGLGQAIETLGLSLSALLTFPR